MRADSRVASGVSLTPRMGSYTASQPGPRESLPEAKFAASGLKTGEERFLSSNPVFLSPFKFCGFWFCVLCRDRLWPGPSPGHRTLSSPPQDLSPRAHPTVETRSLSYFPRRFESIPGVAYQLEGSSTTPQASVLNDSP